MSEEPVIAGGQAGDKSNRETAKFQRREGMSVSLATAWARE